MRFLAAIVVVALVTTPAMARGPESLTPEVRQHIASYHLPRTGPLYLEDRPVLVMFFTIECLKCRSEFERLGRFLRERNVRFDITVVALGWLEDYRGADPSRVESMLRHEMPPLAFVMFGTDETSRMFGSIESVPAYFLYDRAGKLVWSASGGLDEQGTFDLDTEMLDRVLR